MKALILILVIALAGCAHTPPPAAPLAQCDTQCFVPCNTAVPLWTPDDPTSPGAWDTYPEQVVIPLSTRLRQCEVRRLSCAQCIDRLRDAGVIQ